MSDKDAYNAVWIQEPVLPPEPHPCFCVGPKPGHTECPCVERAKQNARVDDAIKSGRSPWDKSQ